MNKICVVIPIHNEEPTTYELISFQQCFRILGQHSITVLAPEGLNLTKYLQIVPSFKTTFINPRWQSSILNYNKLKLSQFFYNLFSDYEYLLTYELDAFVFHDDINEWVLKGYDYIGAPWFEGVANPISDRIIGVGNSGFSLRNIKAMKFLISKIHYNETTDYIPDHLRRFKFFVKKVLSMIIAQFGENSSIQQSYSLQEDLVIAKECLRFPKRFKLAPINEAIKFSFEINPEFLFDLNKGKLPTGCHGWLKYNFSFWRPYIHNFGYDL